MVVAVGGLKAEGHHEPMKMKGGVKEEPEENLEGVDVSRGKAHNSFGSH